MARGINKAILIGNCGGDPETRYLPSGGAVTNITVATTQTWKDKETGQQNERTEWHRVVFFSRLAEIAGEYLKKGSKVYIEGSLRTRQWERDGQKHYTTEIVANEMQMLDSRGGGSGGAYPDEDYSSSPPPPSPGTPPGAPPGAPDSQPDFNSGNSGNSGTSAPSDNDFDDDIPF